MTKEEALTKLKELKKQGMTYKWIAAQIGVTESQLYCLKKPQYKSTAVLEKLTEYFEKGGEK